MLTLVLLGFLLGVRHAADPDHVIAVTAIVSRQKSLLRASLVGALWGLGHTVTLLAAGGAIIAFRVVVPARLGLALEFVVAVMLVVLGIWTLRFRSGDDTRATAPLSMGFRPLVVGVVHGLAGSAAVALLVLATIADTQWALVYLLIFGLGTIAGMVAMTLAVSAPTLYLGARFPVLHGRLRWVAGALSVGVGLLMMHRLGVTDGLFSADPRWTPQ